MLQPIPFRPDPSAREREYRASVMRGLTAIARFERPKDAADHVLKAHKDDKLAADIARDWTIRAAVSPSSTTTVGSLVQTAVSQLATVMGPASAFASVSSRCLNVDIGRNGALAVPNYVASAYTSPFVQQGSPFAVKALSFTSSTLALKTMKIGWSLTREMSEMTFAPQFIEASIRENGVVSVDAILTDANASSAVRPQGVRNGLSSLTPTSGGGAAALIADLANLTDAIGAVSGVDVAFLLSPKDFTKAKALLPMAPFLFLPTASVPNTMIMAIGLAGMVFAGSLDGIQIERSTVSAAHLEDTSPLPIASTGTPNSIAAPVLSAFSQDLILMSLKAQIDWAIRATGSVAFVNATTY
jgi:hypothetical protein